MIKLAKQVFLRANYIARTNGRSKELAQALLAACHRGNLALISQDDKVALCHARTVWHSSKGCTTTKNPGYSLGMFRPCGVIRETRICNADRTGADGVPLAQAFAFLAMDAVSSKRFKTAAEQMQSTAFSDVQKRTHIDAAFRKLAGDRPPAFGDAHFRIPKANGIHQTPRSMDTTARKAQRKR